MKRITVDLTGTSSTVNPQWNWAQVLARLSWGLLSAWLTLGFLSSLVLSIQAPVNAEMLHMASWLGPRSIALHFTNGPLVTLMMIAVMIFGLALAGYRSNAWLAIGPLAVLLGCLFGSSEEAHVRIGVLRGTVKIGCYVERSAECAQQLGVESSGFPSRFMPTGTSEKAGQWSDWYRGERRLVVDEALEKRASLLTMPLVPFLIAPLHLADGQKVERLMNDQLEVAKQLRTRLLAER